MKTVGIIGGIGPEATIAYYRAIISTYRKQNPDGSYPAIVINIIDLKRAVDALSANDLDTLTALLVAEVKKLERVGVDFGVLSSTTVHIVFDEIRSRVSLPLISLVEETGKAALSLSVQRPALFGTSFTMQAQFFPEVFARSGTTVVLPSPEEQQYIHQKYMGELVSGIFLSETRARLLEIVQRMIERERIDAVILGGTELPLILRPEDVVDVGIPFLDTVQIHADAIVAELLSE